MRDAEQATKQLPHAREAIGAHRWWFCVGKHTTKASGCLGSANALIRLQLHGQCRVTEEESFFFFFNSPMGDRVTSGLTIL